MSLKASVLAISLLWIPATARAVTLPDIIELSKAGVPDVILTALIDADRTLFTLDADQILQLQHASVSEAVILKMLRSRRDFAAAGAAPLAQTEAPPFIIVGGPMPAAPAPVVTVVVPYYVAVPGVFPCHARRARARISFDVPVIGLPIRDGEFVDQARRVREVR